VNGSPTRALLGVKGDGYRHELVVGGDSTAGATDNASVGAVVSSTAAAVVASCAAPAARPQLPLFVLAGAGALLGRISYRSGVANARA